MTSLIKPDLSPKRLTPVRIALLYAGFSALWILASNYLLTFIVDNPVLQNRIELAKGLIFVFVTSGLLYLLHKGWCKSLQKSARQLLPFYDLPFIGMAITSTTKRWLQFNDRLCEILGYSREELAAMTWTEITHPDDLEKDLFAFERILCRESEGYVMDKRYIRKDGAVVYATMNVKCVRKPDGAVDFFVCTIHDITEHQLDKEALHKKNFFLAESQRIAHIGSWKIDLATGNVISSEETCRIFGIAPETCMHSMESFYALLHADDRGKM